MKLKDVKEGGIVYIKKSNEKNFFRVPFTVTEIIPPFNKRQQFEINLFNEVVGNIRIQSSSLTKCICVDCKKCYLHPEKKC